MAFPPTLIVSLETCWTTTVLAAPPAACIAVAFPPTFTAPLDICLTIALVAACIAVAVPPCLKGALKACWIVVLAACPAALPASLEVCWASSSKLPFIPSLVSSWESSIL